MARTRTERRNKAALRAVAHRCHADACDTIVPPEKFMCLPHWILLPQSMRDELWHLYSPGQEIRKDPSPEYLQHAMACIQYVRECEGRVE